MLFSDWSDDQMLRSYWLSPVHDERGVARQTRGAAAELSEQSQQSEEVEAVVCVLDTQEHHLRHLSQPIRIKCV